MGARIDGDDQVLFQRAYAELHAGGRPDAVFAALAANTLDYRAAALAVCTAAGIPRAQALQRWAETGEELASLIQRGEEGDLGAILEMSGLFDVHPRLDAREQQVRQLLHQALATVGALPSGYAHGLGRMLQTGRLTDALVSMTTHGARRSRPMSAAYWTHLLAAAELLNGTDDERFDACVALCRQLLDQADKA
jgi:hypothetical protein